MEVDEDGAAQPEPYSRSRDDLVGLEISCAQSPYIDASMPRDPPSSLPLRHKPTTATIILDADAAGPSPSSSTRPATATHTKRQPPSCDACRTRKLKCSGRPPIVELGSEVTAISPCEGSLASSSWLKLMKEDSIVPSGDLNARIVINGREGDGGIKWLRDWQRNRKPGRGGKRSEVRTRRKVFMKEGGSSMGPELKDSASG